ncbi:hypothetical protein ZWY2020_014107 [Hordeum vulgare]|nr:hypothetical protein ZWY2020_014107 [Hordeum vulgare]
MRRFFSRADAAAAEDPAPGPSPSTPSGVATRWRVRGGRIRVAGGLELAAATAFDKICTLSPSAQLQRCDSATFYRPQGVPEGFTVLGHYCQPNSRRLHGHLLVARAADPPAPPRSRLSARRGTAKLVWAFHATGGAGTSRNAGPCSGYGRSDAYFWLPVPPERYRALRSSSPRAPASRRSTRWAASRRPHRRVRAARLAAPPAAHAADVRVARQGLRRARREAALPGMREKGISAGTFWCAATDGCSSPTPSEQGLACLKNVDLDLSAMPTLEQSARRDPALRPRSTSTRKRRSTPKVQPPGRRLERREYWMDIPADSKRRQAILRGDIERGLYAHVKPAMGGTCTDVAMWVFCPFNGPARLKLGPINLPLRTTGQHVGDWGTSRSGSATSPASSWPSTTRSTAGQVGGRGQAGVRGREQAGGVLVPEQARELPARRRVPAGLGGARVRILNEAARSKLSVDSSVKYRVVAEYLGDGVVVEPQWLQFMREWGPTVIYRSRTGTERMVKSMPQRLSCPAENMLNKMPNELSKEEGPTRPKEKNMWEGDERW